MDTIQQIQYATYDPQDDSKVDLSKLSPEERMKTVTYVYRTCRILYCQCNNVAMRMCKDGRIINLHKGHCRYHKEDCIRHGKPSKTKIIGKEEDLSHLEISMNLENYFDIQEKREKRNIIIHPPVNKKPKETQEVSYRLRETFELAKAAHVYSEVFNKNKEIMANEVWKEIYERMKVEVVVKDKDEKVSTKQVEFYCAVLSGTRDSINNACRINSQTGLYFYLPKEIFLKRAREFEKDFGISLKGCQLTAYVGKEHIQNGWRNVSFYPITNHGLVCDSTYEQNVYNLIEEELIKRKQEPYNFSKSYLQSIYDKSTLDGCLDDGQITYGSSNKILVIEVFGLAEVDEEYKETMGLKESFFEDKTNIKLLAIYPNEKLEDIKQKIVTMLDWLKE